MFFSVGDLVTLGIVLLILFVLRALDRNNRSLEKLKRYSDKIMENISGFVEEKTTQLKEISVELAANLSTGKELFRRVREIEDGLAAKSEGFEGIRKQLADYDASLSELVSMSGRVDQNLKRIRDESEFVEGVDRRLREAGAHVDRLEKELPSLVEGFSAGNRESLQRAAAGVLSSVEERVKGLAVQALESEKRVKDFSAFVARLDERTEQIEKDRVAALSRTFDAFEAELAGKRSVLLAETTASLDAMAKDADTRLDEWRGQLEEAARRGETLEGEAFSRLRETIQADEATLSKAIEKIEARLQDYQGDVDYRFRKLEEAGGDIETLEKSLRDSMGQAAAGARGEMKALVAALAEEWKAEIASVQVERAQLTAGMAELGQGLADLKSRAYQDASEKLRVFEDEFFSDLRGRSAAMQEKIQGWQADVESRLTGIAVSYATEREKLEKTYLEELRTSLDSLRKTAGEESERIGLQVSGMEESIRERVAASEEGLSALRETLKAELEKTRRDTAAQLERELAAARDAAEAASRKLARDMEAHLKELSSELAGARKELSDALETSRTDLTVWQGRMRQQMAEAEVQLADRITSLGSDAEGTLKGIRDDFSAQKEQLIVATNGERMALRNELGELGEKLAAFQDELGRTTQSALESLRKEAEGFQLESQKKIRDVQTDVEGRIKEFKLLMAENREKAEAMQEKLFGKIDESYRLLTVNLADIDKRLKGFMAQTKIFERADTLKSSLEGNIEEMKKELARLAADKAEVADLEGQITKTRRLAEEVSSKMSRFLTEKRRIDDMEGEFKKILTMSREVDLKLESIASSSDALQQIQAKVRQFEEMGKVVENGFDRLEKKQEIIDITSQGIDKSFQRLDGLEKGLSVSSKEAESLASKLQVIRNDLETLAAAKQEADSVRQITENLGAVLTELEGRMEKTQVAREWLARTETRFEEVSRLAQEQVRLLETIVKAETKKDKGGEGAPPMEKRETVMKLAHQGWSVPEIAHTTHLSRGEVELILEIAPKV